MCKACYHLLDIIDELQQTLTESKTDVRTKFLETVQKLKLKYPRTDKVRTTQICTIFLILSFLIIISPCINPLLMVINTMMVAE